MITFTATIKKFAENAEKTGWSFIEIPAETAQKIKADTKKSFRVKGKLDDHPIAGVSLMPMGGGDFILTVNAGMRKALRKQAGATIKVQLEFDKTEYQLVPELVECLQDEPGALEFFHSLPRSHQNYFSRWIESAKTDVTRAKRIAMTVDAAVRKWGYGEMIRAAKAAKDQI
ncbi:MAG: DUF1905 domain-containing protein [Chitinophagaceae bacterium]|nr:DUF1905 domain-containing protein [Chitinophagaceae bacterium]MCW5929334.1 DUF1905 domain-containing protein [Chitinophagaceae bacterium]